jgi:hypothetical protein
MKEPKPRRSTIRRGRQVLLLGALLVLVAITQGRVGAAADGMRVDTAGGPWRGSERAEPPARLPPAEMVSYDDAAMFEPLSPSESYVGYNSGFVIANHGLESPATSDFPFFLRVNSWLQLRHTLFDAADPSQDLNLFSLERLRLGLGGHAYSPSLKYFFQFDGNSDQAAEAIFLDYYVTYDLGCEFLGYDANKLGVIAGKWKVPFSRSRDESGRRLQFTERSTSNLFFDLNRSIGVGIFGELDAWTTPIRFETAVFNGFQSGADTDVRDSGLDQNFAWSARVYTDWFSEFGSDGEPDLGWHPAPALRLGFGLAGTRVDAIGANEFNLPRVVDSGAQLASLLPPATTAYDIGLYTIDAHWKHRGRSVIAEYYWRCIANFSGGDVPGLSDHGFNLQYGQFVVPSKLELLTRWSRIAGDSETLGTTRHSTDEVAVGAAWYLNGHNAKFTLDVSRVNGMPLSSPRLDMLPGSEGWLLRTQLQFGF